MLTKEDLKKIEELLQPKFDHIELRLDAVEQKLIDHDKRFEAIEKKLEEHDKRFEAIDKKLEEHDKRFEAIEKKLGEHDKKFGEIERRLDNIVEVVALHTTLLKDISLRLISVEGNVERMSLSVENIWSKLALLSAKIKVQEDKTDTFNMLLDKGKDQYK